jgi:DNA-binding PadR family transcriptional regulator
MDPANLYRSLRRLERDGLVEEVEEAGSGRRGSVEEGERRRYYALTKLGRAVVAAEAARVSRLVRGARAKKLIAASEAGR